MLIKMDSIIKILESELITNKSYIEYEYLCSKCRYSTKHIV